MIKVNYKKSNRSFISLRVFHRSHPLIGIPETARMHKNIQKQIEYVADDVIYLL
jgi:hypothetical protein